MHVISKKALREFWERHADAKEPLEEWYKTAVRAKWQSIADVRLTYPHADAAGDCTVFNIKGNSYRLVVKIAYSKHLIFIRFVLTHAEYSKGVYEDDCNS